MLNRRDDTIHDADGPAVLAVVSRPLYLAVGNVSPPFQEMNIHVAEPTDVVEKLLSPTAISAEAKRGAVRGGLPLTLHRRLPRRVRTDVYNALEFVVANVIAPLCATRGFHGKANCFTHSIRQRRGNVCIAFQVGTARKRVQVGCVLRSQRRSQPNLSTKVREIGIQRGEVGCWK